MRARCDTRDCIRPPGHAGVCTPSPHAGTCEFDLAKVEAARREVEAEVTLWALDFDAPGWADLLDDDERESA